MNRRKLLIAMTAVPASIPAWGIATQEAGSHAAASVAEFKRLHVRIDRGVAFVTIDNPPVNVQDALMVRELFDVAERLDHEDAVRVVVFQSAIPDYFMAHLAISSNLLPPDRKFEGTDLWWFQRMIGRIARMSKATIGKIEGRARGGGSEFLLALDMRFGAIGKAIVGQPEIMVNELPGGGGTQRLTRLIGRGRALELLLSGENYSAELAERYGYLNRALLPDELTLFVETLAYRIAQFSPTAIASIKDCVTAAEPALTAGLVKEAGYFRRASLDPETRKNLRGFLQAGGETDAVERELGGPAQ